jgi:hypothetical protein
MLLMQFTDIPGLGPPQLIVLFLNLLIIIFVGYLFVHWFKDSRFVSLPDDSKGRSVDVRMVTSLFTITALVSPVSLNAYPHEAYDWLFYLTGMTWTMVNMNFFDIIIDPILLVGGLPFTCLRLVFVYQMHRYLLGRTTRTRTIILGISSELQLVLMTYPLIIILTLTGTSDIINGFFIPIPVLLLVGLVIIQIVPTNKIESPWQDA